MDLSKAMKALGFGQIIVGVLLAILSFVNVVTNLMLEINCIENCKEVNFMILAIPAIPAGFAYLVGGVVGLVFGRKSITDPHYRTTKKIYIVMCCLNLAIAIVVTGCNVQHAVSACRADRKYFASIIGMSSGAAFLGILEFGLALTSLLLFCIFRHQQEYFVETGKE